MVTLVIEEEDLPEFEELRMELREMRTRRLEDGPSAYDGARVPGV